MGPGVAVADIRNAVRACLADLHAGDLVLVACSGGADSVALAAALAFTGPRLGLRCGGVTVDHGLQPGSDERAAGVAGFLVDLKLDPVYNIKVHVATAGGMEAAARAARYRALDEVARLVPRDPEDEPASSGGRDRDLDPVAWGPRAARGRKGADAPAGAGAVAVLLGHTLDDQAETVLLGLARGAGARSLAGMPPRRGLYRRPLLAVRRITTLAACAELGFDPWRDPHNEDTRFARVRVRQQALPALEAALGPGVTEALARTARQLRADADCLDDLAFAESGQLREGGSDPAGLDVTWLAALPEAIRTRILRAAAIMAGCPAGALGAGHIQRIDELVTSWHGQRWADLPGGVRVRRQNGRLWFTG